MKPIVIVEAVSAVFLSLLFIEQVTERDKLRSSKLLNVCIFMVLLALVTDATAYALDVLVLSDTIKYIINFFAYTLGGMCFFAFSIYVEAFFNEKTEVNPMAIYILKIASIVWIIITALIFATGKIVVYQDGATVEENGFPIAVSVYQICVMLYTPVMAFIYRRKIGHEAVLLLSFFSIAPILGILSSILIDYDLSFVFCAITLLLILEFLQKKQAQKHRIETVTNETIAQNYSRIFTLQDDFESLYDVELETGEYVIYVKGDFYQEKVTDKLKTTSDFFDDIKPNIETVVYPEDKQGVQRALSREGILTELADKEHFDYYYRLNIDNKPKWFKARIVYKNESKKNIIIGVFDAGEEMAIREKNEQIITGFANQYEATFLGDLSDGSYRVISNSINIDDLTKDASTLTGLFSNYLNNHVIPDDRKKLYESMVSTSEVEEKLPIGETRNYEYRAITKNGHAWYRLSVNRLGDNEVLAGFKDCNEEIINRHMSEKVIADFASVFLVDIDSNTYRFISRNSESGFADVPGGVYTDTIKEYISRVNPKYRDYWYNMLDLNKVREMLSKDNRLEYEYPLEGVNKRWRRCVIQKFESENEIPKSFIMTYFVIDDNRSENLELSAKVAEQKAQLEKAIDMVESANKAKTSFLFNMSHDIRTPMNAIVGFTTMAKKYIDNKDKALEYIEKIDISGQQLLSLINQVLEMSRIESGKIELEYEPISIREKFESLVTVLSAQAKASGLNFNYALKNIRHDSIMADDTRMSQITLNVTGNAIKYTPEGGTIDFELKEKPCDKKGYARYTFTVTDTGIGMSEEYQKKMFEPFERENTSTVSHIQGTGLGLPIVKNLVDLMNGTIEVDSHLGKGTRMDITIDFKLNENEVETKEETKEFDVTRLEGRRALLVEDNEMNREIAKDILEEYGIIVEEANDGDVAVEMVKKADSTGDYHYYDFVLMDIQMPKMNGYEATKAIRALPPEDLHLPIIAMTANAFEEDRKAAFEAGMDDHLAKPIDINRLLESLSRFIR